MNLYECSAIEQEIERLAEQNEGEVPEEKMHALILAQTTEVSSVERLCNYVAVLEGQAEMAANEMERLSKIKRVNQNRIESIKSYIKPWLLDKGGKFKVGTWTLSTRKSTSVQTADDFNTEGYVVEKTVVTRSPDKRKIADDLKAGIQVAGAVLVLNESVQIK